jgi:hypothetical protein
VLFEHLIVLPKKDLTGDEINDVTSALKAPLFWIEIEGYSESFYSSVVGASVIKDAVTDSVDMFLNAVPPSIGVILKLRRDRQVHGVEFSGERAISTVTISWCTLRGAIR